MLKNCKARNEVMKKIILSALFMLLVCFCFAEEKSFDMHGFFGGNAYHTEKISLDLAEINYSYLHSEGSNKIVSKAVFYSLENDRVLPLLIFDNDHIYNSSGLLFHGNIPAQKFYGWNIRINTTNGSVSSDLYTNDGRNVTDGPSFGLNKNTMKYSRNMIDSSEY